MSSWTFHNKPFEEDINEWYGFVYRITEIDTQMSYIGKKLFWRSKTLPVTKSRKRKKKILVESDWRTYFGSSEEVKSLVEQKGRSNFKREILRLCKNKGDCSYYELRYQMVEDVLLKPREYHNAFVGAKIHRKHLTLPTDPS